MENSTENNRTNVFKEAVSNLEFCVEQVIKQLEGEDRNAQLKELKTVMLEYCDLDNHYKLQKLRHTEIERSLAEEYNMNKIDEVFANLSREQSEADPCKHEWYLNLEKKISESLMLEDSDCDIIDMGTTQSLLDPITKRQLTDPVKNTFCGHSYERTTILQMLEKKREMRCPVIGCKYLGYFNENHLEENTEMLRQLRHLENN